MNMEEIPFWHQVPLLDGRITPGKIPIYKLQDTYLFSSIDFRDKTVLDIGCWDGYFSFEAEARGAKHVVGLDDPSLRWGGMAGFNFLKEHFSSSVEWQLGTVYRLPEITFDIILCYGVLYHLSDPLLAATNVFRMSNHQAVFEGLMFEDERPLLELEYPGKHKGDPTNPYTMSTGWLSLVAQMNGFRLVSVTITDAGLISSRCAMLFERDADTRAEYYSRVFVEPPVNRELQFVERFRTG